MCFQWEKQGQSGGQTIVEEECEEWEGCQPIQFAPGGVEILDACGSDLGPFDR
jgi:hypothetical protein